MRLVLRATVIALAAGSCLGASAAFAGDDGAAPIWEGIGSVFGPLVGFNNEPKDPIDYHEHGKIVVPKSMDLPEPAAGPTPGEAWPVNQEILRKRAAKAKEKAPVAGGENAKVRSTQTFPNAPVTVRASDQPDGGQSAHTTGGTTLLGSMNPLNWVGMGKSNEALGAEPDREWLTDPPKGYRAPVAAQPPAARTSGQASN